MKVSELQGEFLDYWVARANGWTRSADVWVDDQGIEQFHPAVCYDPSHDWALGGPIFEREGFGICKFYEPTDGPIPEGGEWCALWRDDSMRADGPTPLVAGMRLFVMSRFGEEVAEE